MDHSLSESRRRHPAARDHLTDVDEAAARGMKHEPTADAFVADLLRGFDPDCRYARDNARYPGHTCVDNDGREIEFGQSCHYEMRRQLDDVSADDVAQREADRGSDHFAGGIEVL
jgi:hypothetical protein